MTEINHENDLLLYNKMTSQNMDLSEIKISNNYEQHDDPDVVIPDKIASPLLISSHLLLVTASVSLYYRDFGLFIVVILLYLTSIYHWHKPRFSRFARIADYLAVLTAIVYGCYFVSTLQTIYDIYWYCGLLFIGIIFATNETMFYIQIMKTVDGRINDQISNDNCFNLTPTKPNTKERDYVYRRTVWVHLICVHILANALALFVVIDSALSSHKTPL